MRAWTLTILLLAVTVSGCADTAPVDAEGTDDVAVADDTAGNETAAPEDVTEDPVGNETEADAVVEEVVPALDELSYQAEGLAVTLLANGSEDGSAIWTIDFDGDGNNDTEGEGTPFQAAFTYAAAGDYVAHVNVSNDNGMESYTIDITVVEPLPEPIVKTGTLDYPDVYYAATGFECPGAIIGLGSGDSYDISDIDGWLYELEGDGMELLFWDGDAYGSVGTTSGEVPAGTIEVQVCSETAVDAAYTLTIAHPAAAA